MKYTAVLGERKDDSSAIPEIRGGLGPEVEHHNALPPNLKEIPEKEFAQSMFFTYTPIAYEHRQIPRESGNYRSGLLSLQMYYFHDGSGIAFSSDYWGGKVSYYTFTVCEHDFRELSAKEARSRGITHMRRCYHVLECQKEGCGYTTAYDSSD